MFVTNLLPWNYVQAYKKNPSTIRAYADECLKKKISLTPEQIIALAKRINITISNLTVIEKIVWQRPVDITTANDLKAKADLAKDNVNAILDTAKQVIGALDKVLEAQTIAKKGHSEC